MKYTFLLSVLLILFFAEAFSQQEIKMVSDSEMQRIYAEVKTPFKFGLVLVPEDDSKKFDCPTVFRKNDMWYMTYIVFDGRGYETWLAQSSNLTQWKTLGRILSFSKVKKWDADQRAGYISLIDYEWGESYEVQKFQNKYWMSYLGGNASGYEKGLLSVGMAFTDKDPSNVHEWQYLEKPVLTAKDKNAGFWENETLYKSTVIWDKKKTTGSSFVMFYNAKGDSVSPPRWIERIGVATSDDMVRWKRYENNPVLDHHLGITGDAYIQKIGDIWVMFYFGAFWPEGRKDAFDRFACSYDLLHWKDWEGEDLIKPSENYDNHYAHKPCVIKWNGVVYHFYNAVNKKGQRGIALATSWDLGKSSVHFYRIDKE